MFEAWLEVDLLLKMYLQVSSIRVLVSFDAATRDNANMDDVCDTDFLCSTNIVFN